MLKVGTEEIEAMARVIRSGELFRYHEGSLCETFERRFADFLDSRHAALCSSGTAALTAALAGVGIGPGDEVIVPAHTYMATAIAVLAAGAIPVIADIDESVMLDPDAFADAIGPRTRAVIPVHMWGALCDMDRILDIARQHELIVVEDACQCIGGFYRGRAAGAMGAAGAYSFNYFKTMTCGEGGAVVTSDDRVARRARCMIDPCGFYWEGREDDVRPFTNTGSRASELQGAMLLVQLERLPALLASLRTQKARILEATADLALGTVPCHSPDGECAIRVMYRLPDASAADLLAEATGGEVLARTGRHNYTEWDPVLEKRGAHHPDLNPFTLPQNAGCRMDYDPAMCAGSLDILARTVSIPLDPDATDDELQTLIAAIRRTAPAG